VHKSLHIVTSKLIGSIFITTDNARGKSKVLRVCNHKVTPATMADFTESQHSSNSGRMAEKNIAKAKNLTFYNDYNSG